MEKRFVIIDGNSLLNRAYYAMQRPMMTKEGLYTQGVYGFLNMLAKIRKDYEHGYMAVAFDRKAPTFRHIEYPEYKAGRKKMPPELAMQMPLLKEVLSAMRITMLEIDGYEADDIIGTAARKAESENLEPLIAYLRTEGSREIPEPSAPQAEPLALAIFPDGSGFYSYGTEQDVRSFSLPPLPEGFIYTGIAVLGKVIAASWEEQQEAGIGAAGFMVIGFSLKTEAHP